VTETYAGIDVGSYGAPTFGDIDGDGNPDLFVGTDEGGLDFYRRLLHHIAVTDSVTPGGDLAVPFGDVRNDGAGGEQATAIFTITNEGNIPLEVSSVSLATGTHYSLSGLPGASFAIAPGASQQVTVAFDPTALGWLSDTVTVVCNDPDEGTVHLALSGQGVLPHIVVTDSVAPSADRAMDLGAVLADGPNGHLITGTITIGNDGTSPLTITGVSLGTGTHFSLDGLPDAPFALDPGESQVVTVTFDPAALGTLSDTLTILSDDPGQGTVALALSGQGVLPHILVTDSSGSADDHALDFSLVQADGHGHILATETVTITNAGTAPLTVTGISLGAGTHFQASSLPSNPLVLAPGSSQQVTVTFDPLALGSLTDTLTVLSDDPSEGSAAVSLSGQGYYAYSWEYGPVTVTVCDMSGQVDFNPADVRVSFGKGNSVKSITLGGVQAMDGVGIVVSGATSVGSISDGRRGPIGELAFIASDRPLAGLSLRGPITGCNLNGQTVGGITFGADIDGDGDTSDLTAVYVAGGLKTAKLNGSVLGDVLIGGSVTNLQTAGALLGDLSIGGDAKNLLVAGDLGYAGGQVWVGGILGKLTVASKLGPADLLSDLMVGGSAGTIAVGSKTFGGDALGAIEVDGLLKGLTVAGALQGDVVVHGDLAKAVVGRDLGVDGGTFQVDGLLRALTVGSTAASGRVLSDLVVTGDLTRAVIYGDLRGEVHVGGNLGNLTVASKLGPANLLGDLTVGGSAGSIVVGGKTTGGDVLGDIEVGGLLKGLTVARALTGDVVVHGNLAKAVVGGDLGVDGGTFQVDGVLKSLTVGTTGTTGHVLSDLLVGVDLTKVAIYGDLRGQVEVGGSLGSLVAHHITSSITVAGNLKSLTTTSTLVAGVEPVDYVFQNPDPEADGELSVSGAIGRVRTV
jgi:hypothetical protein